ncbi:MAG: co-chaperone GroES [Gemmatimonadota bacterium]
MIVLGKRLLVDPLPREEKTKGGIILPATGGSRVGTGTILAVGSDVTLPVMLEEPYEADMVGMIAHYVDAPGVGVKMPDGTLLLHEDQVLTIEEA